MDSNRTTRRDFLGKSIVAGVGFAAALRSASFVSVARAASPSPAQVAITKGGDRADNAFRALQMFKKQIAAAIGDKRVVIKPNFVWYSTALACTHVDTTEGILEFLKSIGKHDVVVAESSAQGNSMSGFEAMKYWGLTNKYPVKLLDLDQEGFANVQIWKYGDINNPTQTTIRVSKMLMNPNNYIISAAPLKTHNTAVVTLSIKNIALGAPIYDIGKSWAQPGALADKATMHGPQGSPNNQNKTTADYQVLNDNIYRLMKVYGIRPHLALLDGFQGMEHNGPVSGTAVPTPQRVAVASLDPLAADRVGLELMGSSVFFRLNDSPTLNPDDTKYPMPFPACLNYLGQAGLGEWDLRKIQVIGEPIVPNIYNYQPHDYVTAGYELANIRTYPRD